MKISRIFIVIVVAGLLGRTASAATGTLTVLYNFGSAGISTNGSEGSLDGDDPLQPPTEGGDGNFYGTTYFGGTNDDGSVYMMTPAGTLTTLYHFQGYDGVGPRGQLIETNGLFYGTTQKGGLAITNDVDFATLCCGSIFTITPQGTFTSIFSFDSTDGNTADSGLIPNGNGTFFGTTYGGGNSNTVFGGTNATDSVGDNVQNPPGTVYRVTTAGTLTTVHGFSGTDGANPGKEAVRGSDGNLYGTTVFGGANNAGTVYTISSAGTFTLLYSFTGGADGAHPKALLTEGLDGNFYGTTLDGGGSAGKKACGVNGCGTAFKITAQGTLTTLHDFNGDPEPAHPGSLTPGTDGNFYGTSYTGGTNHEGTVYMITPDGVVTTLYHFDVIHGAQPVAGLTLASDGSFYGATSVGGTHDRGTIFRVMVDTNCTVALKTTGITLTAKGGAKKLSLTAASDCDWSVVNTNSFITITAGNSGAGNGVVNFTVAPNTNTVAISGVISIKGQDFTVNQAAGGCTYALSPKAGKPKAAGGAATVKVKAKYSDCAWSAESNDSFITITGGTNGVGSGVVSYTVAPNTGTNAVVGTMTIAGETFTVTQAAPK